MWNTHVPLSFPNGYAVVLFFLESLFIYCKCQLIQSLRYFCILFSLVFAYGYPFYLLVYLPVFIVLSSLLCSNDTDDCDRLLNTVKVTGNRTRLNSKRLNSHALVWRVNYFKHIQLFSFHEFFIFVQPIVCKNLTKNTWTYLEWISVWIGKWGLQNSSVDMSSYFVPSWVDIRLNWDL